MKFLDFNYSSPLSARPIPIEYFDGLLIFISQDILLNGFKNISLEKFEEGTFPRKLFFILNEKK